MPKWATGSEDLNSPFLEGFGITLVHALLNFNANGQNSARDHNNDHNDEEDGDDNDDDDSDDYDDKAQHDVHGHQCHFEFLYG